MTRLIIIIVVTTTLAAGLLLNANQDGDQKILPAASLDRIVSQLKPVEELASLKVSVSGIVRAVRPGTRFWQGRSEMVLLVRGQALYSVDLTHFDVVVSGNTVTITLDQPQILAHWVDVERSEVWERRSGRFNSDGLRLEADCWTAGLALVHEAAQGAHYRRLAMEQAERVIRELVLGAVPLTEVRMQWRGVHESSPPSEAS